jgi:hypothetical protein
MRLPNVYWSKAAEALSTAPVKRRGFCPARSLNERGIIACIVKSIDIRLAQALAFMFFRYKNIER